MSGAKVEFRCRIDAALICFCGKDEMLRIVAVPTVEVQRI